MPKEESGLDELMRLSRQFTRQKEEQAEKERLRAAQGKKVRGVLQGLKDLNFNMALGQLKAVAGPEIIREVNALKTKGGAEDLRKIISSLADDLERRLEAKADTKPLVSSMRTLNILLDLYFSLR